MKAEMNEMKAMKSAERKRAGGLAHWAAVLGLGLMSVQALAYPQMSLQATDREAALQELLAGLSGEAMGVCQLVPVGSTSETGSERAVEVECGQDRDKLFFKYHTQSRADAADVTLGLLNRAMIPEDPQLQAMIRKPLAEYAFGEQGQGKGYYTAHYAVEEGALNLRDWTRDIVQRIQATSSQQARDAELAKVQDVYNQLGRFLGAAHRAGLTNPGKTFDQLQSQSAVQGLDGFSVTVTPAGDVKVDLDALVTDGKKGSPARVIETQLETLVSELAPLESLPFDDFFTTLVTIGYSLPQSYCAALEQKPEADVIAGSCFTALTSLPDDSGDDRVDGSR